MQNSHFRNAKAQLSFFKKTIFTKQGCFFTFVIKQQIDNFSAVFLLWQPLPYLFRQLIASAEIYITQRNSIGIALLQYQWSFSFLYII